MSWFSELFKQRAVKKFERATKAATDAATVELESTSILENALDAVVGVDSSNRILFWNKHAEVIFGYSRGEVIGKDMTDLIVPPNLRAGHRAGMKRFVATGIPKIQNRRIEIPGMRRSGELFPSELTVSSVKTPEGDYRFYSFIRDVSVQKQTVLDLNLKSLALENSINGFDIVNAEGKFIYVNRAYMQMWGYDSIDEVLASSPADHCADPSTPIKIITELKKSGKCDIEFLAKRKDGSTFDVRMLAFLDHDAAGKEIYPTTSIDITEQKRAAEELRKSGERYQQVFANSPVPMWLFDPSTFDFVDVNETAVKVYGYTKPEFLKMKLTDIRPPEELPEFYAMMAEASRGGSYQSNKPFSHIKKDGGIIFVQPSFHDLELDGRKLRMSALADITGRVAFESKQKELFKKLAEAKNEAEEARTEAERANQLKSAFLANMSHEIRTPLGAMLGFADLLRDPGLTSVERANYIDILSRNGNNLSVIIDDILDLSKVEAGHLTLEFTETNPKAIVAEVVSLLRVKAKQKDLALDVVYEDSTPESLVSDPVRVRQILVNIVGNAIKFTQYGSVRIRVYGCESKSGRESVCFEVLDTGIGIPTGQQEKIFEMFVQADGSMTRRFGGTGLGLALSRRLAVSLGGDVEITRTAQGEGSTFLISIQTQPERKNTESTLHREENKIRADLKPNVLSGLRVLVVDDAPDNRQLIWHYLNKQGAIVESAENGLLGYRKALADEFDIVLMDIQMPEMDGYTATHNLRAAGYRKPIIALTAHAMSDVRQKCLNVGCTGHLTKPINAKELISAIAEYTGR